MKFTKNVSIFGGSVSLSINYSLWHCPFLWIYFQFRSDYEVLCAANFIRTESEFLSYALLNDLIAHLAHYSSAVPISNDVYMCATNNIIKANHTIDECGTKSKSPIWISRTIERIRLRWETNAKIIKLVFELISGEHVCGASGSNSNNKSSTTIKRHMHTFMFKCNRWTGKNGMIDVLLYHILNEVSASRN